MLLRGLFLRGIRFVGRSLTESKQKIQGFTPTDTPQALLLSSPRGENIEKTYLFFLATPLPCFFKYWHRHRTSASHATDQITGDGSQQIFQVETTPNP
jgi:hypothetical protein